MSLTLYGYRYSVYTWIVRLALRVKGASFETVEIDPFAGDDGPHPFGRVPVVDHHGFHVYETSAITAYLSEALPGRSLEPGDAQARARSNQIVAVAAHYAYWPLVRQVFGNAVFAPAAGLQSDRSEIQTGLAAAPRVLEALNALLPEQGVLKHGALSRGDIHLGPMLLSFAQAEDGAAMIERYDALSAWRRRMEGLPEVAETRPPSPGR